MLSAAYLPSRCSHFRIVLSYICFRNKEGGRNKDKKRKWEWKICWECLITDRLIILDENTARDDWKTYILTVNTKVRHESAMQKIFSLGNILSLVIEAMHCRWREGKRPLFPTGWVKSFISIVWSSFDHTSAGFSLTNTRKLHCKCWGNFSCIVNVTSESENSLYWKSLLSDPIFVL